MCPAKNAVLSCRRGFQFLSCPVRTAGRVGWCGRTGQDETVCPVLTSDQPVQFEYELNKIPAKVVWMLNGQVIDDDGTNFKLITALERKKYTLKIKQAQLSHAGNVTVKTDDPIESTATLKVKRMCSFFFIEKYLSKVVFFSAIPIDCIKSLTRARVNEDDNVHFICELNKPNIHVKWFLHGEPIPASRISLRGIIQLTKYFSFEMIILKFKQNDLYTH
jgi:hypothetical protein